MLVKLFHWKKNGSGLKLAIAIGSVVLVYFTHQW